MPFQLPQRAIEALDKYQLVFDRSTQRKGGEYIADGRVIEMEDYGDGLWNAVVKGREEYEISIRYQNGVWRTECTCPVGTRCKHIYAAIKTLQAQAEVAPLKTPAEREAKPISASTPFKTIVADRVKRHLSADEFRVAVIVQQIYTRYRDAKSLPEYALNGIAGKETVYSWDQHAIWPERPANAWHAWLYLAYALRTLGRQWPPFLAEITSEEELNATIGDWIKEREVARWRNLLSKLGRDEAAPLPEIDLRAVLERDAVRLEFSEGGSPWAILKKTRHDQILRGNTVEFANPDSRLVWAAIHKGTAVDGTLKYDRADCTPGLNELLRNPLLVDRVLSAARVPMQRPSERLEWKLKAPAEAGGDYGLSLAFTDDTPPPDPIVCLEGKPSLYVTADTIYEAAPFWRLNPIPSIGNKIPATVLESSGGVKLLERVGVPLPEILADKVEVRKARLIIEADVEAQWETEHLQVRFIADWGETAAQEIYTDEGWKPVVENPNGEGAIVQPIVQLDRESLKVVPALIQNIGIVWSSADSVWARKLGKAFPEQFSSWLLCLPDHINLKLSPELASLREGPVTAGFRLEVEPAGVDWFDVQTVLSVEDVEFSQAELRALLKAKGGWVRLGQKGWRKLTLNWSEEDEEKLADLGLSSGDFTGEPQRLHAFQLASDRAKGLIKAEHHEAVRRRAEELKTSVNPSVPDAITAELRPYQVDGYHFLAYLSSNRFGGVLADDMGLGKTVQTLTWLAWLRSQGTKKPKPSLVVCPKSVTANWEAEAAKFLPSLRVQVWNKGDAKSLKALLAETDLLVLNYTQLRLMGDLLAEHAWLAAILDEAQAIKNPDSQTARAACLLKAEHRVALSGTPVENRLLDLWSILAFAMPGILGTRSRFAKTYDRPAEDPFARRRLAARVRPFLLRRTKEQVAKDLPPRTEEDLLCSLEGKQETLYKAELKRARQMLLKISSSKELDKQRFNILTSLLRLRQICCHPALVDATARNFGSAKMEALLELLEPLMQEGHKVLVFSQFVGVLELIREEVVQREWQYSMLTGDTENRGELVNEFQTAKGARVFLLSLKAGGAGLNLTAASYVVLFDPWWNPAVENQAIDRTHRIGQTEHVNAYRLLTRNTIEEKIRNLQKTKSALAEDILGEEAFARTLTLQDFQFLLGSEETEE